MIRAKRSKAIRRKLRAYTDPNNPSYIFVKWKGDVIKLPQTPGRKVTTGQRIVVIEDEHGHLIRKR